MKAFRKLLHGVSRPHKGVEASNKFKMWLELWTLKPRMGPGP